MMSELKERRWAVLSERGCEESGVSYEEATGTVARLRGERVRGLCVVTEAAASHIPRVKRDEGKPPAASADTKPRRSRRKSTS